MKKIIALVICVMMLASSLVVGISAARSYDGDWVSVPVTNKVLDTSVSDGTYVYLGGIDLDAGSVVKFDIEFVTSAGTYSDVWGMNWITLHTDSIGVADKKIAYNFNLNTVYALEFDVESGATEIKVNGNYIGTVGAQLSAVGFGVEGMRFDNFYIEKSSGTDYSQDFEGYDNGYDVVGNGRWYFSDGNAGASAIYQYNVVEHSKYLDTNISDGTYIYCSDINFGAGSTVAFDLRVIRDGTYSDGWGQKWFNFKPDKIGVDDATIAYAFDPDTWYKVVYEVGDGSTEIFVNGTSIGTVAKQLSKFACGVEGVQFDNICIYNGNKVYNQDFEGYAADYDVVGNGRWYFSDGNAGGSCIKEYSKELANDVLDIDYNKNSWNAEEVIHHDAVTDGKAFYFANEGKWPDGSSRAGAAYLYTNNLFDPSYEGKTIMTIDLCALDTNAYLNVYIKAGVTFDFAQQTIGVGNVNIPLDTPWNVGEWHTVTVYSSFGDVGSVIMVDGALLSASGSVCAGANAKIGAAWCGGATNMGIDNIKIYTGDQFTVGDLLYSEDFEDDAMTGINGDCNGKILAKVITPAYDEVVGEKGEADLGEYYWFWNADNQYAYINGLNGDKAAKWEFDLNVGDNKDSRSYYGADPIFTIDNRAKETQLVSTEKYINATGGSGHMMDDSVANDEYTFRLVFMTPSNYYDENKPGEFVRWVYDGPQFNMVDGTIGYAGKTLDYAFAYDTLYTVDWVVDGDTTIFVNGTEVGTLEGAMKAQMYGAFYRTMLKELSVIKGGEVIHGIDVDDYDVGDTVASLAGAEVVEYKTYAEVETGSAGTIGVGNTTLTYNFKPDTWYHVVLDGSAGNGTEIYVDGTYVGKVANTIKATWCGKPGENVGIDNLKITADGIDYFEDFEDKSFGAYDGNGSAKRYDFSDILPPEPVKSVYEFIETEEVGGRAYLIKGGYDYEVGQSNTEVSTYYDMEKVNPGVSEYVINFDLALIPTTDVSKKCFIELWCDVATRRFVVGTDFTGYYNGSNHTEDFTAFEWGEATKDNFHNVTYIFRDSMCVILVDGVQVYEGLSGATWTNMMIGNVYNGSAIIDNLQLFKFTNANKRQPNELEAIAVNLDNEEDVKKINLDAEDFCAANGHIQKNTVDTTPAVCEATGVATTYCAICGGEVKTSTLPALGHSWPNYYNGVQKAEGVWKWECKRGCGKAVSTTVPTPVEGSLDFFADFSDAFVVQGIADIFTGDGETIAKGIGTFNVGCGQNYNQFDIRGALRNQYTVAFDFRVNELFDDNDTNSYGHTVYFWYGGDSGIANEAGYDFDRNVFFAKPSSGEAYAAVEVPYELTTGVWHQLMFKVYAPGEESDENWVKIFLDGEEVLSFDEWYDTTYYVPTEQGFCIIRDFGVAADIDNFAIGTVDLELTAKRIAGDLTGDGMIGTKDIKLMKLAIAERVTLTAAERRYADINNDGRLDSKDLAALKKLIVA